MPGQSAVQTDGERRNRFGDRVARPTLGAGRVTVQEEEDLLVPEIIRLADEKGYVPPTESGLRATKVEHLRSIRDWFVGAAVATDDE